MPQGATEMVCIKPGRPLQWLATIPNPERVPFRETRPSFKDVNMDVVVREGQSCKMKFR